MSDASRELAGANGLRGRKVGRWGNGRFLQTGDGKCIPPGERVFTRSLRQISRIILVACLPTRKQSFLQRM